MKSAVENSVTPMVSVSHKTPPPAKRDWLKTAGWAKNDALYSEAVRLGMEYRLRMTAESEHADS